MMDSHKSGKRSSQSGSRVASSTLPSRKADAESTLDVGGSSGSANPVPTTAAKRIWNFSWVDPRSLKLWLVVTAACSLVTACTLAWLASVPRIDENDKAHYNWLTKRETDPDLRLFRLGRIEGIQFQDATHGWAFFQDKLLRTTDGGKSWAIVPIDFASRLPPMQGSGGDSTAAPSVGASQPPKATKDSNENAGPEAKPPSGKPSEPPAEDPKAYHSTQPTQNHYVAFPEDALRPKSGEARDAEGYVGPAPTQQKAPESKANELESSPQDSSNQVADDAKGKQIEPNGNALPSVPTIPTPPSPRQSLPDNAIAPVNDSKRTVWIDSLCVTQGNYGWIGTSVGLFKFKLDDPKVAEFVILGMKDGTWNRQIQFHDSDHGWILSQTSLWYTADGGKDWLKKEHDYRVSDLQCAGPDKCLVKTYSEESKTQEGRAAPSIVVFHAASDQIEQLPLGIQPKENSSPLSIVQTETNSPVSFVSDLDKLYAFGNAVNSWYECSVQPDSKSPSTLDDLAYADSITSIDRNRYVALVNGFIWNSADQGRTWTKGNRVADGSANFVDQLDSNTEAIHLVVTSGDLSRLMSSYDLGKTWSTVARGVNNYHAIISKDRNLTFVGSIQDLQLSPNGDVSLLAAFDSKAPELNWQNVLLSANTFRRYRFQVRDNRIVQAVPGGEGIVDVCINPSDHSYLIGKSNIWIAKEVGDELIPATVVTVVRPEGKIDLDAMRLNAIDASKNPVTSPRHVAVAVGDDGAIVVRSPTERTFQIVRHDIDQPSLRDVLILDDNRIVCVGDQLEILISDDLGKSWRDKSVNAPSSGGPGLANHPSHLNTVAKVPGRNWLVAGGTHGMLLTSKNNGDSWQYVPVPAAGGNTLRSIHFVSATEGFIAGDGDTLLRTSDSGLTWTPIRSYASHPPTAFYSLILLSVLLLTATRWVPTTGPTPTPKETESIAEQYVSDAPVESHHQDQLQFNEHAEGLSRYLRHEKTTAPLAVAITGDWGSGKSSLMNLLKKDLESYGWQPVWFNAWHFQNEENMLAALLQAIRSQGVPPIFPLHGVRSFVNAIRFRMLLAWERLKARPLLVPVQLMIVLILVYSASYLCVLFVFEHEKAQVLSDKLSRFFADGSHWPEVITSTGLLGALPIAAIFSIWRALRPFYANPIDLLRTVDSSRGLQLQSTFRDRFASNFKEVTKCLGENKLIIFIDDLDRCDPENVMVALQTINFLMSSGECFVVLGMAIDRVQEAVAMAREKQRASTKSVAGETSDQFAKNYLEKLVQLDFPVPTIACKQASKIVQKDKPSEKVHWAMRFNTVLETTARLALLLAVPLCGYLIASTVLQDLNLQVPAKKLLSLKLEGAGLNFNLNVEAQTSSDGQAALKPNVGQAVASPGTQEIMNSDTESPALPNAIGTNAIVIDIPTTALPIQEGREVRPVASLLDASSLGNNNLTQFVTVGLCAGAVLCCFIVCIFMISRSLEAAAIVVDSKDFKVALEHWLPLYILDNRKPRSIKRLVNRARAYAMFVTDKEQRSSIDAELLVAFAVMSANSSNASNFSMSTKAVEERLKAANEKVDSLSKSERKEFSSAIENLVHQLNKKLGEKLEKIDTIEQLDRLARSVIIRTANENNAN